MKLPYGDKNNEEIFASFVGKAVKNITFQPSAYDTLDGQCAHEYMRVTFEDDTWLQVNFNHDTYHNASADFLWKRTK